MSSRWPFYTARHERACASSRHGDKHAVHLALISGCARRRRRSRGLVAGVDEAALAARSVPDKWSMKELICHFKRMETIFSERFRRMLAVRDDHRPLRQSDATRSSSR